MTTAALSDGSSPRQRMLHPSIPLRFADVIEELRAIAQQASDDEGQEGSRVALACRRAESLLWVLRAQFLNDVVGSGRD